ncbi:MAG: protein translocase subunit SecD [Balneolaceae bacterium]|nr:protein translocase subunit SecD [Balneolaceae bacterium]MCH8549375.1 protein translocase subunit SecD [Balneolaceae bacterium]
MKKQNNGFKLICIAIFIGLTAFYLYPTIVYNLELRHMAGMTEAERISYETENAEKIQSLRERSLSLGLDLQGGMYVTLEIGEPQLILELAGDLADDELREIIDIAAERAFDQRTDFIDEFVNEFESRDSDAMLSRYYRSDAENITRRSSNSEIASYLRGQRDSAVSRAMEIMRSRVDRFGVAEPSIVQQGTNRIIVELPGVDDEERVRNLLQGTARLEFRMVAEPEEINSARQQVREYFQELAQDQENGEEEENLLNVFSFDGPNQYVFGYAAGRDTSTVNRLMQKDDVRRLIPRNTTLMWGARPFATDGGQGLYELIAVRSQVELTGDVITEARVAFDPTTNVPEVSMTMDSDGSRRWSRITGANIGRPVAIALDGYIESYPTVQSQINNGRSSITGIGGLQEAEDLVNILLSGALPAPLDIIEERTVGASLGEASIRAGLYSIIFGLSAVAIFMIVYYRTGGGIADLALILNIIFILGILAGFQATLTLPGIAGIVLTIGMAVDANVLIFDRIREEMRGGKTLRAAIDNGYSNAMSAIVDANVTTFFVAIILFSFGVGPIKGFAITLMAGIVASLFSAIVITRVIVDYLTREKTAVVSFG